VGFQRITIHPETHPELYQTWTRLALKYEEGLPEEDEGDSKHESDEDEKETEVVTKAEETVEDKPERARIRLLMAMMKRESSLRLSPFAQQEMDRFRHSESQVTVVTEGLQVQTAREFGFNGTKAEQMGVTLLQSASNMYPNHPQIKDTFYVKFNRCEPGNLIVGQECPDVPLYTPQGEQTTLLRYYQQLAVSQCGYEQKSGMPAPLLVVVAGSST